VCIFSGSLASSLLYSTFLGGEDSRVFGIAVDSAGNAYITGYTYFMDFPVTSNAFQTTNRDTTYDFTAFISKINTNSSGTASLVYSTFLGGSGAYYNGDAGNGIAIDFAGNAYITGYTGSTDFPVTSNAFQTTNRDTTNNYHTVFISKINTDSSGTASLVYSSYLGGKHVLQRRRQ
jgi:large repetitive protein